ncbi:hypothetical protein BCR34DRAFT_586161 [Clohesyomyces aquaticus]|uniref:Short-chain dehydrogenase n=1 Tax=Clohesyomyces aquaticus TaxID=1231657 RepID=A0A1Y1ZUM6_9PLEO|nr:hypothetical protein BCR34DRAFT_586161 [Clohesyomyces aquaticus]
MSSPVAFILGAGPRVGAAVAQKFLNNGYKVAIASRSGKISESVTGVFSVKADLTKPETVPGLFDAVKAEFKEAPSVVIYNAAALAMPPVAGELFSISGDTFASDLNINTVSAYVAAQQAVVGWETLSANTKKSFIYTGNILNVKMIPIPMMLTLGVGKSASAFWIELADTLYSTKGSRFYYADERFADGRSMGQELSGPAHADFFAQLANHEGNVPWHATFVKDKGYVQFK